MFEVAKTQCYKNKLMFRQCVRREMKLFSRILLQFPRNISGMSGQQCGVIQLSFRWVEAQPPSDLFGNDKGGSTGNDWPEGSPNFA